MYTPVVMLLTLLCKLLFPPLAEDKVPLLQDIWL
jgi:hypothetical protein